MNNNIEATFLSKYANFVDYDYVNDKLVINDKSFEKYYKKEIKPLQEYLKNNEEPRQMLRTVKMRELWMEHCTGNVSNWEMQVLDFYFGEHELQTMPIENYLKIDNFEELDEEPTPIRYNKWKGHEFPVYDTSTIVGTVIDKNKVKSLIYVLTQYGVVTVKIPKNQYVYYDRRIVDIKMVNGKQKKVVIENSWFTKGSILVVSGYRKGTMFMCKKGKNQKHSIMKINRYNQNNIEFLQERLG